MVKSPKKSPDKLDPAAWHRKLITKGRYKSQGSSVKKPRNIDEEANSDRARVIYSSAFRRLQQKTQVFTLSKDAAVRSRLSHSLEVASTGRWIAQKVADSLLKGGLEAAYGSALVTIVETGCLAHDVGNPPFGHFGEAAIREWFEDNWQEVAGGRATDPGLGDLVKDFLQFDGNPQGMRILLRLQGRTREEREEFGMDLTFTQVLASLKYPRGPADCAKAWKKAGFFESERDKIEQAWEQLGFKSQQRFPLAYIVEAADDISYCISDMEDGIDRGMFTPSQFFEEIVQRWTPKSDPDLQDLWSHVKKYREETLKKRDFGAARDMFFMFKTEFGGAMIGKAASLYGLGTDADIAQGTRPDLFDCKDGKDAKDLLEKLKEIARNFLYPSDKVERPFLAGLQVVRGILDAYGRLLKLTQQQFALLRKAWHSGDRREVIRQKLETLLPLLDLLPSHYLEVYDYSVGYKDPNNQYARNMGQRWSEEVWEWFSRAHLIVDNLSGMTDDFAYRTYRIISGTKLE